MRPAVVTVLLLSIVGTWNNYFLPLAMLSELAAVSRSPSGSGCGRAARRANNGGGHSLWSLIIVGSLVSIIPLIIAFLSLQKYWQGGLSHRQPEVARPAPLHRPAPHPNRKRDHAQQPASPSIPHFAVGAVNRRLFGSFVEHLGRCVYDGIYEPGHPTADADGFRAGRASTSCASSASRPSATRAATSSPASAGRTASGPSEQRPTRLDLAWHSTETNEVGLHEFAGWLEQGRQRADARGQPRHPRRAGGARPARVHEHPLAARRCPSSGSRTGAPSPSASGCGASATRWTGRGSSATARADDYGKLASQTAKAMRQLDPSLELVVCGSLERADADVRRVGAHGARAHLRRRRLHLLPRLLRGDRRRPRQLPRVCAIDMDRFIEAVVATADHVKAVTRQRQDDQHLVRRVERLVPRPLPERRQDHGRRQLARRAAPARGRLLGRRRGRRRQPADLAAQARRPGDLGVPRAAGQRDRADHDRARRRGVAPDDVLPVRAHRAPRAGRGAEAGARGADLRDRRVRRGAAGRRGRDARRGDGADGGLPGQPVGR